MERQKTIIRTSIVGIVTNILLATFKAIVGFLSNSIAIILDALNNVSDVLSSTVTIVGAKLAGKAPDREHPFGHGRVEYLSAMIIAVIILYAGGAALIEAVKKIINPTTPDYDVITLVVVIVAIVVKIVLSLYVQRVGEDVKSKSLVNSGKDAMKSS